MNAALAYALVECDEDVGAGRRSSPTEEPGMNKTFLGSFSDQQKRKKSAEIRTAAETSSQLQVGSVWR